MDPLTKTVTTRYYISKFMERASAADVLEKLKDSVKDMDKSKLFELFMNTPNVSVSFLSSLNEDGRNSKLSHVISIVSCGIHKVNNSVKYGEMCTTL